MLRITRLMVYTRGRGVGGGGGRGGGMEWRFTITKERVMPRAGANNSRMVYTEWSVQIDKTFLACLFTLLIQYCYILFNALVCFLNQ